MRFSHCSLTNIDPNNNRSYTSLTVRLSFKQNLNDEKMQKSSSSKI